MLNLLIKSLIEKTKNLNHIEVFIIADNDDKATIDYYKNLSHEIKKIFKLDLDESAGYYGLNYRLNKAAKLTRGKFIMFIDDDAVIETQNWDEILLNSDIPELAIIFVSEENCWGWCHPIITRKYYELSGHFSGGKINDNYLKSVAELARIEYYLKDVKIKEYVCSDFKKMGARLPRHCKTDKSSSHKGNIRPIGNKWQNISSRDKGTTIDKETIKFRDEVVKKIKNHPLYKPIPRSKKPFQTEKTVFMA